MICITVIHTYGWQGGGEREGEGERMNWGCASYRSSLYHEGYSKSETSWNPVTSSSTYWWKETTDASRPDTSVITS